LYDGAVQSGYVRDKKLYEAVGKEFIPFKDNTELQQLIQATIAQTKQQMVNITQTLGFAIDINGKSVFTPMGEYLHKVLDTAVLEVASGTFDYNTTLKKVVYEMVKSGVRSVDYETGWSNRIEVAARRALMTGITQVTNHINDRNADELGTDMFEVSWHSTARPSHQEWQGRVYTKKQLVDICGLGTGAGLMGWNCYHSYYPFIEGVSERQWTDEQLDAMNAKENTVKKFKDKEYNSYEATQRQRELETLMRAQRRKIKLLKSGAAAEDDIQSSLSWYRETMRQYKIFSEEMKLPQQMERVYVDRLGKVA
jgi:plasmid maintenance system killer protein